MLKEYAMKMLLLLRVHGLFFKQNFVTVLC